MRSAVLVEVRETPASDTRGQVHSCATKSLEVQVHLDDGDPSAPRRISLPSARRRMMQVLFVASHGERRATQQ